MRPDESAARRRRRRLLGPLGPLGSLGSLGDTVGAVRKRARAWVDAFEGKLIAAVTDQRVRRVAG